MLCIFDPLFNVNFTVAERRFRFRLRGVEKVEKARLIVRNTDAAAAAACDGFDTDGVSDFFRELHRLFSRINRASFAMFPFAASATGDEFQPCLRDFLTRLDFVTHRR